MLKIEAFHPIFSAKGLHDWGILFIIPLELQKESLYRFL